MKKVLVIGCSGSGKTTLSRKLARKNNLSLLHLDNVYFQDSRNYEPDTKKQEWRKHIEEEVKKDRWLMDGCYTNTLDIRIPAADTVIFLDYPRWLVVSRILRREIRRHPDASKNEMKNTNFWKLFEYVWQFKKEERPKILRAINEYGKDTHIHILTNSWEAEKFLSEMSLMRKKIK